MRKKFCYLISIVIIPALILSCSNACKVKHAKTEDVQGEKSNPTVIASPPVIVYKTKADYYDKVPVTLSEDKTEVISFPGTKDVFYKGELAYPSRLNDGYLLDNRGIDPNSAFLNITYEDYSKLESTPSKEELLSMILDKDPFTRMYRCGNKYDYKDIINELNSLIENKKIKKQIRLK